MRKCTHLNTVTKGNSIKQTHTSFIHGQNSSQGFQDQMD